MSQHPSNHPVDVGHLDRYLAGEASSADRTSIDRWASADPARLALLECLPYSVDSDTSTDLSAAVELTPQMTAAAWRRFLEQRQPVAPQPRLRKRAYFGLGATVVAALFVALWFAFPSSSGTPRRPFATESAYTVYSTRPGERTTVVLSDGTKVMLSVASTLEVPRDFGSRTRTVRLVGHGSFDVSPKSTHPFVVDAAGTRTRVLGTVFSVRAYEADVHVAVQSGKVSVSVCDVAADDHGCGNNENRQRVLSANDMARISPVGEIHVLQDIDIAPEFAFTAAQLILRSAPLREIVSVLERWYNVDIVLADPTVGNLAFTGALPAGSPDNLVQALEFVLNVHAVRRDRVITIGFGVQLDTSSPQRGQ